MYSYFHDEMHDGKVDCKHSWDDERFCDILCPTGCECQAYTVKCNSRGLFTIPSLSEKTRFSSNSLRNIKDQLVLLHYLAVLILSNNRIISIASGSFDGLLNVRTIDLSHNELQSLKEGTFDKLESLRVLNIENNLLEFIEPETFYKLKSLKW